jgi:hypothetical protein
MDARVRRLQIEWPTTTTMLELPIYLAIMGVPNGMEPVGTNLTNMDRRFLPSSCRS